MSNYSIRKLEPEQFDLLLPMMKDCFGMDVNIDYFRWKFLENPAGSFIGFIAKEDSTDEVAAYYGAIPQKFIFDNEVRTIYQSCDTMTHSSHRRKGLFQKLATHCFDYLRENNELFLIGFGGGQSTPGFLKFGWQQLFDFQNLFIPKPFLYTSLVKRPPQNAFVEISDLYLIGHLIGKQPEKRIYAHRDVEHLQWRYRNPERTYKIIGVEEDGQITGFVCFYVHAGKLFLFDYLFSTKGSERYLIHYLKQNALNSGLSAIVAFCHRNGLDALQLKKSGFINNPFRRGPLSERTPFIIYSTPELMDKYGNEESWLVRSYDHDSM